MAIAGHLGADALRWWFLRDVPRSGDADFREELLISRANELADGLGNLVNRTITLVARFRPQGVLSTKPRTAEGVALDAVIDRTPRDIDNALARFDFRAATASIWQLVDEANRFVAITRPWELTKRQKTGGAEIGADLDETLDLLLVTCRLLARELEPFLPAASARISHALADGDPQLGRRLFPKVEPT